MQTNFSPSGAISAAVSATKSNWYILAAFMILIWVVNQIVSSFLSGGAVATIVGIAQSNPNDVDAIVNALMLVLPTLYFGSLGAAIVSDILRAGMVQACLDVVDGNEPQFSAFTRNTFNTYLHFILCSLIVSLLTFAGYLLCCLPGIYVGVRLLLAPYYVMDKKLNCIDAIKQAWTEAGGNWWNLFLFVILAALCNIGGALLCCVGLLYTVPMTMVATTIVYRTITSQLTQPTNEPTAETASDNYVK